MKKIYPFIACVILASCNQTGIVPTTIEEKIPEKVVESNSVTNTTENSNAVEVNTLKSSEDKIVETATKLEKVVAKKTTEKIKETAKKKKDVVPTKHDLELTETPVKIAKEAQQVLTEKSLTKKPTAVKKPDTKEALIPTHEIWDNLTKKYVSANGKVNYQGFKTDIFLLQEYLKTLEANVPSANWARNEKLAYWFNLYNAATVYLVASNYPVNSIKDINDGKPWDKKFISSGAKTLSLNEVENTIVRPNYNEPRLHVAFNCAAVSCPNLLNEAFIANKLDRQLNKLAKQWISDISKNDLTNPNQIKISQIFNWYTVDFKDGVIPFLNKYHTNPILQTAKIEYLEYDWSLNN